MRTALLSIAALIVLYVYAFLLVAGIGYALAQPIPAWWPGMFSAQGHAVLTWMVLCHTTAVVVVSLPVAFLIQRLYGRYAPAVALAMTLVLFSVFALPVLLRSFGDSPFRIKVVTSFDQIKLLGVLPLLAWAFGKLSFKQRSRGSYA